MNQEIVIHVKDDYIKLGQAIKLAGIAQSGVDAKFMIQDELVKVNGIICTQRGKKIVPGDTIEIDDKRIQVKKSL